MDSGMNIGFLDVPPLEIKKAQNAIEIKAMQNVCKILPRARFYIGIDGRVWFATLVCSDLGGKSTGVAAANCQNCKLEGG